MTDDAAKTESETESDALFFRQLMAEDHIGLVLRVHLYLERLANRALAAKLSHPEALKHAELDYSQKIHLLAALGLPPAQQRPLLAVGTLRNAFAHDIDAALDKERCGNLFETFTQADKRLIRSLTDRVPDLGGAAFPDLSPPQQFAMMAVALRRDLLQVIADSPLPDTS